MFKLFIPPSSAQMFQTALREYRNETHRIDEPTILNNEGQNVARETMRQMPKASAAKIRAQLGSAGAPSALAVKIMRKRMPGASRAAVLAAAKRMVRAKLRSVGYIKAGQIPIIKDFGGRGGQNPNPKSHAAKSTGEKAKGSQSKPTATLTNRATGSGKVGQKALQTALRIRAARLSTIAKAKMQRTAKKYSGK